ncbi:MAG: GNAT family N-acetyltransferase [Alphaproteobacteria bacterium]|nr:GNAT family N-acetyltransferase [Alphaproteobacteria bacterium]
MQTGPGQGARLRPAAPSDAPAIARLHATVWCDTYRTLAPDAAYRALDETHRRARWQAILADAPAAAGCIVVEIDGAIAGFGLCGPPGDPAFGGRGEVKYLYVDRRTARRGLGRLLLVAMADHLHRLGFPGLALGVVVGNEPAIAFYQALGGRMIGRYRDPGPLWRSDNLVYAWDDLPALFGRGGAAQS